MSSIGGRGNSGPSEMEGYKPSDGRRRDARGAMASAGYSLPSKDVPLPVSPVFSTKVPTNFDLISKDRGPRLPADIKVRDGVVGVGVGGGNGVVGVTRKRGAFGIGLSSSF